MNLIEISNKFPTELHTVAFFERKRWGKKIKCAYCNSTDLHNRTPDHRVKCRKCDKTSSVTVGTHLQGTRIPLKSWIIAFAIVADAKKGLSALQLQRNLGVSYPTAWNMYHKIRELMMIENKELRQLDSVVEMDETFIGGKPRKFVTGKTEPPKDKTVIPEIDKRLKELKQKGIEIKRGRGNPAKPAINPKRGRGTNNIPVVGIVQRDGNVVAEVMKHLTYDNLKDMVKQYVDEDDAVLITDEYPSYHKMNRIIEHIKIDHQRLYSYKGVNTNSIESFWAIIKRQIIGQHHHVSARHLPKYVAETVFKYNNRKQDDMFETLVSNALLPTS